MKTVFAIVAIVLIGEARATTVVVPPGPLGDYSYDTNLVATTPLFNNPSWSGNPVQQQDKLWTYISSSASLDNAPVHFDLLTLDGVDHHNLRLADNAGNYSLLAGIYHLVYSIQVLSADHVIDGATLGVDGVTRSHGNSVVDIVKTFRDAGGNLLGTLHSSGGNGDDITFNGVVTFLTVDEVITVAAAGLVTSTTDTFTERPVPEPHALAIWGLLGAMVAGFGVWHKRKAKV